MSVQERSTQVITGVIAEHAITGPHQKEGSKSSFMKHKITFTNGESISLIGSTNSENPNLKNRSGKYEEIEGLNPGVGIQVFKNKPQGSAYASIEAIKVLGPQEFESTKATTLPAEQSSLTPQVQEDKPNTSKDLSMELSGLLQALLTKDHYYVRGQKQMDNGRVVDMTYVSIDLLRAHMKVILQLKDELAATRGTLC